jgi:hypothetical protein
MEKCLDHIQFQCVEGNTDSLYFAIAGKVNEGITQGFKQIITDETFFNEKVYLLLPSDFYSINSSNTTFESGFEKMSFDKNLLGYAIEKEFQHLIALAH